MDNCSQRLCTMYLILSEIFMADILRQQTTLQRFFFVQLVVTVCRSNNDTNRRIKRSGSFIYLAKLCRHLTTCAYLPSVIECHLRTFFFVVVHLYFSSLVPHILLVHWKFVVAVCWRDPAQPATAETPFCRCCCFLMLQKRTHLFYYYILHGRQSNITIINFKKIMQIEFHSDCNQVKCSIIYMLFFTSYSVCVARHTVVIHNTHRQLAQT